MKRLLPLLLCLLTLPACHAADSIAFVRDGNVWLVDAERRSEQQLTHSGKCSHPSWSPDGTSLTFSSEGDIWTMKLPDHAIKRLTTTHDCYQPAWRPETDEIWYCRLTGKRGDEYTAASLWLVTAEKVENKQVATLGQEISYDAGGIFGPDVTTWRPDGKVIAVQLKAGGEGCGPEFYTVDGKPWRLGHGPQGSWGMRGVAWSPVRPETLAAGVLQRGAPNPGPEFWWELDLIDQGSGGVKCLSRFPANADGSTTVMGWWPTWSLDGSRLAFCRSPWLHSDNNPEVWIITGQGTDARKLADNASQPAWGKYIQAGPTSPTSSTVPTATPPAATTGGGAAAVQIVVAQADGTLRRMLLRATGTTEVGSDYQGAKIWGLSFSPDGRQACWRQWEQGQDGGALYGGNIYVRVLTPLRKVVRLTHSGDWADPTWTPDGRRLVCCRNGREQGAWTIDVGTGQCTRLWADTDTRGSFSSCLVSPDARYVAIDKVGRWNGVALIGLADPAVHTPPLVGGWSLHFDWTDSGGLLVATDWMNTTPAEYRGLRWLQRDVIDHFTVLDSKRGAENGTVPLHMLQGLRVAAVQAASGGRCFAALGGEENEKGDVGEGYIAECFLSTKRYSRLTPTFHPGPAYVTGRGALWCDDSGTLSVVLAEKHLLLWRKGAEDWQVLVDNVTCFSCTQASAPR